MAGALGNGGSLFRLYYRTIVFGLTMGLFTAAIILAIELMWQAFNGTAGGSADVFAVQSMLVFMLIGLISGGFYAVVMWFKSDIRHLLIGDIAAGGAMGIVAYLVLLASTAIYGNTIIHLGFDGARPAGPGYAAGTLVISLVAAALIGAVTTSAGAVTCRTVIKRKRPSDRDLRNAGLTVIGLIILVVIAPPLAALALAGI